MGRDWSDWLEELDEKCISMSSDIATVFKKNSDFSDHLSRYIIWLSVDSRFHETLECRVFWGERVDLSIHFAENKLNIGLESKTEKLWRPIKC